MVADDHPDLIDEGQHRALDPVTLSARAVLDEISDFVAVLDRTGHVLHLNRTALQLAGIPEEDVRGLPLWSCPPFVGSPDARERIKSCCQRAALGEPAREEIELELGRHQGDGLHERSHDGDDDVASNWFGFSQRDFGHSSYETPARRLAMKFAVKHRPAEGSNPPFLMVQGRDVTLQVLTDQMLEDLHRERDLLRHRLRQVEPAGGRPPSPPVVTTAPVGRPRVLVVEDNPEMNRFLTEALSRLFDVDSALDGAAGLARAVESPPDLVLTDLMMPRLNGDALVRALRTHAELDDVPIVLLTAKTDDDLRVRLLREGAQDYLAKPFSAKELLIRVGNLVDVKRTRQILREEVATQGRDLESLARALAARSRELESALETTRLARENAERAGEAKNLFLTVASHELRTPITALQLRLDRLRRALTAAHNHHEDDNFKGVQRAIDRLNSLVESLLQYSRVQSSGMPVAAQTFDARGVLAEIVDEARDSAEQKGIVLSYLGPSTLVPVETDRALFRVVVANLVDNALKFTDHGRVDVSLEERMGDLKVSVRDTGPGVPSKDQARIFEPFFHLESADNKHTPGVGLGLALVREVTAALRGTVELESEVGSGSTFAVVLPRGIASEERLTRPSDRAAESG